MKETENKKMKFKPIEVEKIDRIGIKLNPEMVSLLADRALQAKKAGRGINILIKGNVMRGYGIVESDQGEEYSHTLYDDVDGEITIFDWDPTKAYNGEHKFWLEGFVKRK